MLLRPAFMKATALDIPKRVGLLPQPGITPNGSPQDIYAGAATFSISSCPAIAGSPEHRSHRESSVSPATVRHGRFPRVLAAGQRVDLGEHTAQHPDAERIDGCRFSHGVSARRCARERSLVQNALQAAAARTVTRNSSGHAPISATHASSQTLTVLVLGDETANVARTATIRKASWRVWSPLDMAHVMAAADCRARPGDGLATPVAGAEHLGSGPSGERHVGAHRLQQAVAARLVRPLLLHNHGLADQDRQAVKDVQRCSPPTPTTLTAAAVSKLPGDIPRQSKAWRSASPSSA